MFGLGNEEILKGTPPNWKDKEKFNFKEWYKDYCQDYHWDWSVQSSYISDENGDGFVPSSYKLFVYNMYRKFRGWHPIYVIRMAVQRIFRKNHLSDNMLWDARTPLIKYSYKIVKAFKESERNGYPSDFSEYNEHEWKSEDEYKQAIADGKLKGGGFAAWEKVLDIILMAMEHEISESSLKKQSEWYLKYFGMDPHDDTNKCNEYINYSYREIDAKKNIGSTLSHQMPDLDKVEWCTKEVHHSNLDLIRYAEECVQYGFELYGKYILSLWD